MKKYLALFLALLLLPTVAFAAIPLTNGKWSTTFNCADWTQNKSGAQVTVQPVCDGMESDGAWYIDDAHLDKITAAANYSGGNGGKGFRHYRYNGDDVVGGGIKVSFPTSPAKKEFWIRWYSRWESGFKWLDNYPSYEKDIYIHTLDSTYWTAAIPGFHGSEYSINNQHALHSYEESYQSVSPFGWDNIMGGNVGDGQWHSYEVHVKMDTGSNNVVRHDGISELWIDGVNRVSNLAVDWSYGNQGGAATTGWDNIEIGSNCYWPNVPNPMFQDFDDIEISFVTPTTTDPQGRPWIGPITSGTPAAPTISGTPSATATIGMAYSFTPTATGTPTFSYTGVLPPGLSFNSATGAITGTPTTAGTYANIVITAINAQGSVSLASFTITVTTTPTGTVLFSESFENANLQPNGWYDNYYQGTIVTGGQTGKALQWYWGSGTDVPTNGGSSRHKFTPTDSLYLSFYVKFDPNWRGSGVSYHPHMINIYSDLDDLSDNYAPLARNYLNAYIEFISDTTAPYAIRPQIAMQDARNVNTSAGIPSDLRNITETRSAFSCNSPPVNGATSKGVSGICYADGSPYYSAFSWLAPSATVSTNIWHKVEVYLKMNTINTGTNKGQWDGIMKEWIDGVLVINRSDVLYRTAEHPTMKWANLVLAPYISTELGGAPRNQTMWLDELTVATVPIVPVVPPDPPPAGANSYRMNLRGSVR